MKILILISVLSYVTRADFASDIATAHNQFRKALLDGTETRQPRAAVMPMLEWDPIIAANAQKWADRCVYGHSTNEALVIPGYPMIGENIAAGSTSDGFKATTSWYNEINDYDYETGNCRSVCGHYTQVVWANSVKIGCGIRKCENIHEGMTGDFIVCQYSPTGNWYGKKPYKKSNEITPARTSTTTTTTAATPVNVFDITDDMVSIHNNYRRNILNGVEKRVPQAQYMPDLVNDEALANSAMKFVEKCGFDQPTRSDLYDKRFRVAGSVYSWLPTANQEIAETWYSNIDNYHYEGNKCDFYCDDIKQMVYAKSTKLGCAKKDCDGLDYVACFYGPAANQNIVPYEEKIIPYEMSPFAVEILEAHNKYRKLAFDGMIPGQPRAKVMPSLVWDQKLTATAQKQADECDFSSTSQIDTRWDWVAESMIGDPNYVNATKSVEEWYDYHNAYTFETGKCNGLGCNYYTQIVWAATTNLGCAVKKCTWGTTLLCLYGPGGNLFIGEKPYVQA